MADGHFEAKVSGRRESTSGIFLTLQIQPDDHTPELAMLRVGSALMIGWSEVVDTTVHKLDTSMPVSEAIALIDNKLQKERRAFKDLSLSQQAGIRCADKQFQQFIVERYSGADAYTVCEANAATLVREICLVKSRTDLDGANGTIGAKWFHLERDYQSWLTEKRYKDSYR